MLSLVNTKLGKRAGRSSAQTPFGKQQGLINRPVLVWGLLAIYCGLVFIGSSISNVPEELGEVPDYVLHFFEYFIMGLLANMAFRTKPLLFSVKMASIIAALFCLTYGVSDEFHQYFVQGRFASLSDIGSDLAGAAVAQLVALLIWRVRTPRKRRER